MRPSSGIEALRKGLVLAKDLTILARSVMSGAPYSTCLEFTNLCPIGCNCIWRRRGVPESQMTDEEVLTFLYEQRKAGVVHIVLSGGEPYVRSKLLKRVLRERIVKAYWVVTSGVIPMHTGLEGVMHFVSIDGLNQTHDTVRKSPGLFNKLWQNLTHARATREFPVMAHMTINQLNMLEVDDVCRLLTETDITDGLVCSTFTPSKANQETGLVLTDKMRADIVEMLLQTKMRFGERLVMSKAAIERLHPDATALQTPQNCLVAKYSRCYNSKGERIPICVIMQGEYVQQIDKNGKPQQVFVQHVDCKDCGTIVNTMLNSAVNGILPDLETIFGLAQTLAV